MTGHEAFDIPAHDDMVPGEILTVTATDAEGDSKSFDVIVRLDTPVEVDYYKHGGILQYVLRGMMNWAKSAERARPQGRVLFKLWEINMTDALINVQL